MKDKKECGQFFWEKPQKILVILAHPDDPEFFCGGTIAKWVQSGHHVIYCLLTKGEKGINEFYFHEGDEDIVSLRLKEQKNAAAILGVTQIFYFNHPDGYLTPSMTLRRQVVKLIRKLQSDIVVGCDPTNYFIRDSYINHPDHRAAGQIVIDAIFPAAHNAFYFPDLNSQGYRPHKVKEVWLSLPNKANTTIDITDTWKIKIKALHEHKSQIGDEKKFDERMLSRRVEGSTEANPLFEEAFTRIILN